MILTEAKITELLDRKSEMLGVIPKGTHASYYKDLFDIDYVWYCIVMGLGENLTNSRKRSDKFGWRFDLTLKYLAELWFEQNGRCALTNILLDYEKGNLASKNPFRTSVDRIDNNRGYVKGNVRLLTHWANNAKSTWDDDTFKEFVVHANKKVVEHA